MEDQFSAYPPLPETMAHLGDVPELTRAWEQQSRSRQAQAATISALLAHTHRVVTELCADPNVLRSEVEKVAMHDAAQLLGVSDLTATTILNAARFARDYLPSTWKAFHQGSIDLVRVRKIVEVASETQDRVMPSLDEQAAEAATTRSIGELKQWLIRHVASIDLQAHARLRETRHRDRSVRCEHFADGMSLLTAYLPTIEAAAIQKRLAITARRVHASGPHTTSPEHTYDSEGPGPYGVVAQAMEAGWHSQVAEGNEGGRNQATPGAAGPVTLAQREADIFSAWLRTNPTDAPAPIEAKIMVMIPEATLTGDSDEPGMAADRSWTLSAEQARALAGDPHATHQWYTGVTRPRARDADVDILATTYTGRYPPAGLRDSIIFRDGSCQVPGCTIAAERCDLDHREPWETGGVTRAGNLQALCRRHHRLKSHGLLHPRARDHSTNSGLDQSTQASLETHPHTLAA